MSSAHTSPKPLLVEEPGVSRAWARTMLHVLDGSGTEISPLVVSITGLDNGDVKEDDTLRANLDARLAERGGFAVETVAWTIFPQRLWRFVKEDRARFFRLYPRVFAHAQAMNRVANRRGLYFERLTTQGPDSHGGNQLEYIIDAFLKRSGVRRSMFQASVFDPRRDHVRDAQLRFPCLQHVSFVPVGARLVTNAFYATQQIFDKAYGNYLGLARLGAFMASQMNLTLDRLNLFVGVAKLERISKTEAGAMRPALEQCLYDAATTTTSIGSKT